MQIKSITYDYTPAMCTQHSDYPETFSHAEVGIGGVVEILEHQAMGEGDKWYYDIVFDDGSILRTFNPNKVTFTKTTNQ